MGERHPTDRFSRCIADNQPENGRAAAGKGTREEQRRRKMEKRNRKANRCHLPAISGLDSTQELNRTYAMMAELDAYSDQPLEMMDVQLRHASVLCSDRSMTGLVSSRSDSDSDSTTQTRTRDALISGPNTSQLPGRNKLPPIPGATNRHVDPSVASLGWWGVPSKLTADQGRCEDCREGIYASANHGVSEHAQNSSRACHRGFGSNTRRATDDNFPVELTRVNLPDRVRRSPKRNKKTKEKRQKAGRTVAGCRDELYSPRERLQPFCTYETTRLPSLVPSPTTPRPDTRRHYTSPVGISAWEQPVDAGPRGIRAAWGDDPGRQDRRSQTTMRNKRTRSRGARGEEGSYRMNSDEEREKRKEEQMRLDREKAQDSSVLDDELTHTREITDWRRKVAARGVGPSAVYRSVGLVPRGRLPAPESSCETAEEAMLAEETRRGFIEAMCKRIFRFPKEFPKALRQRPKGARPRRPGQRPDPRFVQGTRTGRRSLRSNLYTRDYMELPISVSQSTLSSSGSITRNFPTMDSDDAGEWSNGSVSRCRDEINFSGRRNTELSCRPDTGFKSRADKRAKRRKVQGSRSRATSYYRSRGETGLRGEVDIGFESRAGTRYRHRAQPAMRNVASSPYTSSRTRAPSAAFSRMHAALASHNLPPNFTPAPERAGSGKGKTPRRDGRKESPLLSYFGLKPHSRVAGPDDGRINEDEGDEDMNKRRRKRSRRNGFQEMVYAARRTMDAYRKRKEEPQETTPARYDKL